MGIISFIVLGLIAGAIAKMLWGGLGSFFSLGTWLIAIGGALVFLFVFDLIASRGKWGHPAAG